MSKIRVRYAPSPTGHLHIGGARTALFNYLFARHHGGEFIIRIEDTDMKRNVEGGDMNQLQYLKWLGLDWDESVDIGGEYGPYRCSERLPIYQEYVQRLIESGHAYYCYCNEEELEEEREQQRAKGEMPRYSGRCSHLTDEERKQFEAEGRKPSVRFRVPAGVQLEFDDLIRGHVKFDSDGIGDFVILKKDGMPTYNFNVVVDDALMKITHVFRGEEHLSNTPKQLLIYDALGFPRPQFGHVSLILNEQRKKLSKRDESIIQFIEQYKEMGYLPEAILNFIALLGWSPEGEEEIFSLDELVQLFDVTRLSNHPAIFDKTKMQWMNNVYMKKAELDQVVEISLPHLIQAERLPEKMTAEQQEWAHQLIDLYQEQMSYGAEIVELSELFFTDAIEYGEEAKEILKEEQVPEVLAKFAEKLKELEAYEPANIKQAIKAVQKETGYKGKKLFMPIRVACTGFTHGPDLDASLYLLGKEKVLARLQQLLNNYKEVLA
ncbi:glutamate--tRNA ligase [Rubeoparvulum massiliense]|uniref:glutamate--tRNA ligase n=1 Tax=Rubeoparvulum massiliense TaxID=1631346 RepID=UPI00065E4966|nr:glutamate--tRNA ligase [Rubeoparvulum massiliense]